MLNLRRSQFKRSVLEKLAIRPHYRVEVCGQSRANGGYEAVDTVVYRQSAVRALEAAGLLTIEPTGPYGRLLLSITSAGVEALADLEG